ncbi:MAG: hypothetical protein R2838_18195 [Caldilineaceae bacterium]
MEALAVVDGVGNLPFEQLIATDGIWLNRNDTLLAVSADPRLEWAYAADVAAAASTASPWSSTAAPSAVPLTTSRAGPVEAAGVPTYVVRRARSHRCGVGSSVPRRRDAAA